MSDALSPEDSFRLQVLLAQDVKAVRLDESAMKLLALTAQGEASITLMPNCRPERYVRLVREQLSGHALNSPGGYPVYLSRWTRHGQVEGLNLGKLLLTGEPEAVVAVVHSPGLSDALAEYAWWIAPTIENARLMLSREAVARGRMGVVLAEFLVEHLPFLQDDHLSIMDAVAVLIHSRALTQERLETLWKRGKRNGSHYVAFLEMAAQDASYALPSPADAHPDYERVRLCLPPAPEAGADELLLRALSPQGQTFLGAAIEVLERPETQEVVSRVLNAIGRYFSREPARAAESKASSPCPAACDALVRLGGSSEQIVWQVFTRSTAIGSLMRRKIEPVTAPLLTDMRSLRAPLAWASRSSP